MSLKLKYLLNFVAIFAVFMAFRPDKRTTEDYVPSLVALAIASTIGFQYFKDRKAEEDDHSAENVRRLHWDMWGIVLALAGAGAMAFIVPAIHRSSEQQEAQRQAQQDQEETARKQMFADPKVQQGLKALEDYQARHNAQTQSTTHAATATAP